MKTRMDEIRGNPRRKHPVLDAFLSRNDCEEDKACLAFRVYLDLCEVRGWRDVELHYDSNLQIPYVSGRPTLSSPCEVAVPVTEEESLSHHFIQSLLTHITVGGASVPNRIMLAICASDTSIVYYKVTNDIVKPEPLEANETRRHQWTVRGAKRKQHVADSVDVFCQQREENTS